MVSEVLKASLLDEKQFKSCVHPRWTAGN